MSALEKMKENWKKLFLKERLRLLGSASPEVVDFLLHATLTNAKTYKGKSDMWSINILYSDAPCSLMFLGNDGGLVHQGLLFLSPDDLNVLEQFFLFADFPDLIKDLEKEREEKEKELFLEALKKNQLNQEIISMTEKDGYLYYQLKNGDTIKALLER